MVVPMRCFLLPIAVLGEGPMTTGSLLARFTPVRIS